MKRKSLLAFGILSAGTLAARLTCHAQGQVYSQGVYSGGLTQYDVSSTSFAFAAYGYTLTELAWTEDANGYWIMDIRRKPQPGDASRRCLEVKNGNKEFYMPLDSGPLRGFTSKDDPTPVKGSGNFASVLMQCLTNRGGRAITNTFPTLQYSWVRGSLTNEDIFILPVDAFAPIKDLLTRAYGKPDSAVQPTESAGGNCQTINYTPDQAGVFLNLTRALDDNTIVSIIGTQVRH